MTTLVAIFLLALAFSLVLTPLAGKLGTRLGVMDMPAERKVHAAPIPRIGGLAVFLSFVATIALTSLYETRITDLIVIDRRIAFSLYGALVVFGCGLWDDFRRLKAWIKLLFQILGATIAFAGGVSIGGIFIGGHGLQFGLLSYLITVFWFVLFINAVNLIDGLDGLAAGIVFFTCLLMVVLSVMRADYLSGIYFAALGGAVLGFLRYNFNPASIFLGDGGTYFLGYTVAALSIIGSVKSQVGALFLIPLIALGVPVFDTMLSPVRRWVKGKRIFQPDNGHIHHHLLNMGLSSRSVVLSLYGATVALCVLAILIVNLRNEMVGLILVILGIGALILLGKSSYLEYLVFDKFYGWFRDVTDEAGFTRARRTFLAVQLEAGSTKNLDELWAHIGKALEMLKFERAELHLKSNGTAPLFFEGMDSRFYADVNSPNDNSSLYTGPERRQMNGDDPPQAGTQTIFRGVRQQRDKTVLLWVNGYYRRKTDCLSDGMLRIDLPLYSDGSRLLLMKDIHRDPLNYYTLRRVEHLRRTFVSNLARLQKNSHSIQSQP